MKKIFLILAAAIFAQIPSALQLLGGGLILGGILWYSRMEENG